MHVQGDVERHQGRKCALGHVKHAARDAIVFHRERTETRICVHAMLVSKHMVTSLSALRKLKYIYIICFFFIIINYFISSLRVRGLYILCYSSKYLAMAFYYYYYYYCAAINKVQL